MASYLFPALLLLFSVVFCALCGAGSADLVRFTAELFKRGSIDVLEPKGDEKENFNVLSVSLPSAVCANGVMVALVETIRPGGKRGILTKYIGSGGDNWSDRAFEENGKNWEAQWAWKDEKRERIAFASVARENSIYVLSASEVEFAPLSPQQPTNTKAWDFQLTVGRITYGADATREKKIEWDTPVPLDRFVTDIQEKLQDVVPFNGRAFLTEDGTLVFVVRVVNRATGEYDFVVAHSRDPNSDFTFTYVNNTAGCYSNFFSWGEQLFMVPLHCKGDRDYELQASNDMGETWGEATGLLAEKLGKLGKGRDFFTPITIEGKRVLLFTKEESESGASQGGDVNINLYIANDNYSEKVGPIVTNVRNNFCGSFFYENDELFFLDFQDNHGVRIFFTPLKERLGKIKLILKEWYPEDS